MVYEYLEYGRLSDNALGWRLLSKIHVKFHVS